MSSRQIRLLAICTILIITFFGKFSFIELSHDTFDVGSHAKPPILVDNIPSPHVDSNNSTTGNETITNGEGDQASSILAEASDNEALNATATVTEKVSQDADKAPIASKTDTDAKKEKDQKDPEETEYEEEAKPANDGDEAEVADPVTEKPLVVKDNAEDTPTTVPIKEVEKAPLPNYASLDEAYSTHFMTYLILAIVLFTCAYVAMQYKKQIGAFFNRGGGRGRSRRRHSARYERLQMYNPAEDEDDIIY